MDVEDLFSKEWSWLIELSIGLAVVIVLSFFVTKIIHLLKKKLAQSQGFWRKKVHQILHLPLQIAIWGFGSAYVIDVVGTHFGFEQVQKYVRPLKGVFVVASFSWITLRWIKESFHHLAKRSTKLGVGRGTIYALGKLCSFIVVILTLLIIFPMFGFNIAPLLAFGGIGVAGIAFAAQDIIANFFGGAMLQFTRVFSVGDEIVIPSKDNFEGEVKEMGWYTTTIEDYYRRPVYFPNALFTKAHVINESRRSHRRIKGTLLLRYEDLSKISQIVDEIKEKVGQHPDVDETQSFSVSFSDFGEYGLNIFYYLLVYKMGFIKFLQVKQEIFLIIEQIVKVHGAEFCYPTQNVNIKEFPRHQK